MTSPSDPPGLFDDPSVDDSTQGEAVSHPLARFDVTLSPLQITLVYVVFAMGALFVSDVLLVAWVENPTFLRQLQAIKGALEILLTAGLIYVLTLASQRSLTRTNTQLERRKQELHVLQRLFRHNVRNDINIVRGWAEWLLDRETDATTARKLETIVTSSTRIVTYVDKSKRISNLPLTQASVEPRDLVEIVDTALDQLTAYATDVDVSRETPDSVRVTAHQLLEFGVFEIMDNAVSHNESETPELSVTVRGAGEWVTLRVADNGPGIPEHEQVVLHNADETPLIHSNGVGLWLAYWATTRSGGEFEIADNDPCGSLVTMRLPRAS